MKTKLVWRLGRLPEPIELQGLVKDGIITKDEARAMLVSSETLEDRDKKSLESEIKFLRDLVEKLSSDKSKVVEVIRTIQRPYYQSPWYTPYQVWCGAAGTISVGSNTASLATINGATFTSGLVNAGSDVSKFSTIKTF